MERELRRRKSVSSWAIAAGCIGLAVLLGVQALSSVLTRKGPEQAVMLFGYNGLAREQLAFREFQQGATEPEDVAAAAIAARPAALETIAQDPLAPKALAILALSSPDASRKADMLRLSAKLNRRDIALQGLVLEQALEESDYDRAVATLDQILRVHPGYRQQFYPVLLQALAVPEGAPAFVRLLDGTSPWHGNFLVSAARKKEVQLPLASIRSDLFVSDSEFDRRLIAGLVRQGAVVEAKAVYDIATDRGGAMDDSEGRIAWTSEYPPFDWRLASENDFRAQPSRDGERLEIFARAGQGGVVAQRIVPVPGDAFHVELTLDAARGVSDRNLRIQIRCSNVGESFFEAPLQQGRNRVSVFDVPEDCPGLSLEIYARAMSGEPTLRAELERIELKADG